MSNHVMEPTVGGPVTAHKLDALGWGLFFIWIGIVFLANLGWGIGLVGFGVVVLGVQIARKYAGLTFEAFWAVVGTVFVIGGIWELLSVRASLIPILCIAAGVWLFVSVLVSKPTN